MNFNLFIVFTVEISYSSILVNVNQQGTLQKTQSIVDTCSINIYLESIRVTRFAKLRELTLLFIHTIRNNVRSIGDRTKFDNSNLSPIIYTWTLLSIHCVTLISNTVGFQ